MEMLKDKRRMTISILIPAHNEEGMIGACVESCLNQTRKPDQIVVVDDSSTDKTRVILDSFGSRIRIVTTPGVTGNKSRAQEFGLEYITSDIVIATDGDTILDPNFVAIVGADFEADPNLSVVSGYVESLKHNALTALREIDYTVGQDFFKRAQSIMGFVLVIPGCAGAFKTELFRLGEITFDHDTLTEDLDFTYKLNALSKKIKFNSSARVYTQDPPTLYSYINQMRRWYAGGWQNLKKHLGQVSNIPNASLILTMVYVEGVLFSMAMFILPLISLFLFFKFFVLYIGLSSLLMGLYASYRKKRWGLFFVSPLLPFITVINSYILLEQLVYEVVLSKKNMVWFHPKRAEHTLESTDNLIKT